MVLGVAERRATARRWLAGELLSAEDDDIDGAEAKIERVEEAGGGEEVGGDRGRSGLEDGVGVGAIGSRCR